MTSMRAVWSVLGCVVGVAGPAACTRAPEATKPTVLVSVPPQAFAVKRIAGEGVHVVVMVPAAANHATYEPNIEQMRAASRALIYFRIGHPNFPFEGAWFDRVVAGNDRLQVVDAFAGMERIDGDPHIWTSPRGMRSMARNVTVALAAAIPAEARVFEANRDAFEAELDSLDAFASRALAPYRGRKFFVFHPAWGYFARDYGLIQVSIEHGAREASAHDLQRVIEDARADGARTVFVQPQFSKRSATLVADEVHAGVAVLDPLSEDWPGSMSRLIEALQEALAR